MKHSWIYVELNQLVSYVIGGDWGQNESFDDPNYSLAFCIRASEIKNWQEDKGKTAAIRKIKNSSIEKRKLEEGDILIEISGGGPEQPVGRTVLIDKSVLGFSPNTPKICTNFFRLARPNKLINSPFLNLFLQFFYKSGRIVSLQAGSNNLRNLKFKEYLSINIPLPPLPEQRAIVSKIEELFSELDNGIANLKAAKEKLEIYRQAVLKKAFEGKLTNGLNHDSNALDDDHDISLAAEPEADYQKNQANQNNHTNHGSDNRLPKGWKWVKLGEVAKKITDGEHLTPKRTELGYLLLSARNIQNGYLDLSKVDYIPIEEYERIIKRCNPEYGDILISCSGTIGRICSVPKNILFTMVRSVALVKLDWNNNLSKFYEFLFQSPNLQKQISKSKKATAQANLFLGPIKNLFIIQCPISDQKIVVQEIESRLSVCDKLTESIDQGLEKAEALRQSILKKAFEGKLLSEAELEACRKEPDWEPAEKLLERIKNIK